MRVLVAAKAVCALVLLPAAALGAEDRLVAQQDDDAEDQSGEDGAAGQDGSSSSGGSGAPGPPGRPGQIITPAPPPPPRTPTPSSRPPSLTPLLPARVSSEPRPTTADPDGTRPERASSPVLVPLVGVGLVGAVVLGLWASRRAG
jgi:hypothetical protein